MNGDAVPVWGECVNQIAFLRMGQRMVSHRQRDSGMTLIELIVAVGILALIIVVVGRVFMETSRAVSLAQARAEANAAMRTLSGLIRDDLKAAVPGSLLVISDGRNAEGDRVTSPMLLLVRAGSCSSRLDGREASASIVLYRLAPEAAASADAPMVLMRYEHLLTGDESKPKSLADLPWGSMCTDPCASADTLGASLRDLMVPMSPAAESDQRDRWVHQALHGEIRVNLAPVGLDDPGEGGLQQLWPVAAGGVRDMRFEYCDGWDSGFARQTGPGEAQLWHRPLGPGIGRRRWNAPAGHQRYVGQWVSGTGVVVWNRQCVPIWPKLLRIRLTWGSASAGEEGWEYEIVAPVGAGG